MVQAADPVSPNRSYMLDYISTCEKMSTNEWKGVARWAMSLRLAETTEQLPAAIQAVECIARLYYNLLDLSTLLSQILEVATTTTTTTGPNTNNNNTQTTTI